MTLPPWALILIGLAAICLTMGALWLVQRRTGNAAVVDVGWTFGIGALGVFFAIFSEGALPQRLVAGLLPTLWALRLGTHLAIRVFGDAEEDGRYQDLRKSWGDRFQSKLFVFFQMQAVFAVAYALPFLCIALRDDPFPQWHDGLGLTLWIVGYVGVWLADRQLAAHKRDPASKGTTCRRGLWRYSRHPNYFFEQLLWTAYVFLAIGGPWWPATGIVPASLLYLFLFVTGIPPTEKRALQSRGDDYRRYQATTSAFVPWFPKAEPAADST